MKYLVTGGCGFLGSNLANEILSIGEELIVFDNLSRTGSIDNLNWLKCKGELNFISGDIRNSDDVEHTIKAIKPDIVFHLAGQVAMTTSLSRPILDFETNARGTLNVIESIRRYSPESSVLYSSTNKVYGDLTNLEYIEDDKRYHVKGHENGFNESLPLQFSTPYGCSKGTADQYILDYSRLFGVRGVVFRHSSMYGGRQFPTADQGWIGWFCKQAILQKTGLSEEFTISGNGKQVRDVLHAEDMVRLYMEAAKNIHITSGNAYNIGGGIDNSLSLLELFEVLENKLQCRPRWRNISPRQSDQLSFIADTSKIKSHIGWKPLVDKEDGIEKMLQWIQDLSI